MEKTDPLKKRFEEIQASFSVLRLADRFRLQREFDRVAVSFK